MADFLNPFVFAIVLAVPTAYGQPAIPQKGASGLGSETAPKTIRQRIGNTYDACVGISTAAIVGSAIPGTAAAGAAWAGITVVPHVSGALILSGAGGYMAGTLGGFLATGLAILSSPVVVAVGGTTFVSAAGVGGYCLWQRQRLKKQARKENPK
jgi:hypothetical protein